MSGRASLVGGRRLVQTRLLRHDLEIDLFVLRHCNASNITEFSGFDEYLLSSADEICTRAVLRHRGALLQPC